MALNKRQEKDLSDGDVMKPCFSMIRNGIGNHILFLLLVKQPRSNTVYLNPVCVSLQEKRFTLHSNGTTWAPATSSKVSASTVSRFLANKLKPCTSQIPREGYVDIIFSKHRAASIPLKMQGLRETLYSSLIWSPFRLLAKSFPKTAGLAPLDLSARRSVAL